MITKIGKEWSAFADGYFELAGNKYHPKDLADFLKYREPEQIDVEAFTPFFEKHKPEWKINNAHDILDHVKRMNNADLKYPVIFYRNTDSNEIKGMLDGWHRIMKAKMNGVDKINALRVTKADLDEFMRSQDKLRRIKA